MNSTEINLIAYTGGMSEQKNSSFTPLDLGPTGHAVAENVARRRFELALSYNELSKNLKDHCNHEIPPIGLRRIEAKARRVTVDDLFALASVFGTSPTDLLIAPRPSMPSATGAPEGTPRSELEAWVTGGLKAFDNFNLLSYYEGRLNELRFTLRLKKDRIKQLQKSRYEYPDLLDYDQSIEIVEKSIKQYELLVSETEQKYKSVSEAYAAESPYEFSEEDHAKVKEWVDTWNKAFPTEDE